MSGCKERVYKTMSRPGIDKGGNESQVREFGREWNAEGVRVIKSGSVKSDFFLLYTARVNAVLSLCRSLRAA